MREIVSDSVLSIASSSTILRVLYISVTPGSTVSVRDEVHV